jgi:hypothetical protein
MDQSRTPNETELEEPEPKAKTRVHDSGNLSRGKLLIIHGVVNIA